MKEHKTFVEFSIKSFENARRFRSAVEAGDFSHDYGRHGKNISSAVTRCLAYTNEPDDCVRLSMPGLVLLEYWNQAYAFVRDSEGLWHSCWVDEEFNS